ncbi:vimentin-type intermediate filament-associated coiled-coil protein-like [Dendrobates tinctorius]|uniref:vimentin-type intermediate filament-associated coiled-coil protein-like n=1 Tax=Dendrobates tinctorius TaxID=92724 RepID=UPI003CC9FEF3
MSSPTASQDSEANVHLTALYKQLEEQEGTIREQAERLIKKDEQHQASLKDLADAKDRAVAELQVKLAQSEEEIEKLMASIKNKDRELECRRQHSRLLAEMCRSRPMLASLVSLMEEAEVIPCLPNVGHGNGNNLPSVHHHAESDEGSDVDRTLFGTTV